MSPARQVDDPADAQIRCRAPRERPEIVIRVEYQDRLRNQGQAPVEIVIEGRAVTSPADAPAQQHVREGVSDALDVQPAVEIVVQKTEP